MSDHFKRREGRGWEELQHSPTQRCGNQPVPSFQELDRPKKKTIIVTKDPKIITLNDLSLFIIDNMPTMNDIFD